MTKKKRIIISLSDEAINHLEFLKKVSIARGLFPVKELKSNSDVIEFILTTGVDVQIFKSV